MPRVVIIGGGPAGIGAMLTLAYQLTRHDGTEVVLMEKSKYTYHALGTPRALVEPSYTDKIFIPFDNAIPEHASFFARVIRGLTIGIDGTKNEIRYIPIGGEDESASGAVKTIMFDYLILATGSTYPAPINQSPNIYTRKRTESQLSHMRDKIEEAKEVLIVGGGAVGCEIAGEIKSKFPKKSVTIVESSHLLVNSSTVLPAFRSRLDRYLSRLGIKVIRGETLTPKPTDHVFEPQTVITNKGREIKADIQICCVGFKPSTDLMMDMDPKMVDADGFIKVNDQLQLDSEKYQHIFALGDTSNHPTPKMALHARLQGEFLGMELVQLIRGEQEHLTKRYISPSVATLVLPLGPKGGVTQLPYGKGMVFGNFVTRTMKGKDMFAGKMWQALGQTMPK